MPLDQFFRVDLSPSVDCFLVGNLWTTITLAFVGTPDPSALGPPLQSGRHRDADESHERPARNG